MISIKSPKIRRRDHKSQITYDKLKSINSRMIQSNRYDWSSHFLIHSIITTSTWASGTWWARGWLACWCLASRLLGLFDPWWASDSILWPCCTHRQPKRPCSTAEGFSFDSTLGFWACLWRWTYFEYYNTPVGEKMKGKYRIVSITAFIAQFHHSLA